MAPEDDHILIPKPVNSYHRWQRGLCRYDKVKNLEMGVLSLINWIGPM